MNADTILHNFYNELRGGRDFYDACARTIGGVPSYADYPRQMLERDIARLEGMLRHMYRLRDHHNTTPAMRTVYIEGREYVSDNSFAYAPQDMATPVYMHDGRAWVSLAGCADISDIQDAF